MNALPTILVVEDELPIRELIATILTRSGFRVEEAAEGDAGWSLYCTRGPYDLVLTDHTHPGKDGIELAKAIRKRNRRQALALMSGDTDSLTEFAKRHHIAILRKPFVPQELLELVRRMTTAHVK